MAPPPPRKRRLSRGGVMVSSLLLRLGMLLLGLLGISFVVASWPTFQADPVVPDVLRRLVRDFLSVDLDPCLKAVVDLELDASQWWGSILGVRSSSSWYFFHNSGSAVSRTSRVAMYAQPDTKSGLFMPECKIRNSSAIIISVFSSGLLALGLGPITRGSKFFKFSLNNLLKLGWSTIEVMKRLWLLH